MARYLVGDVQGCCGALQRLLAEVAFSPSRDTLCVLGDMVNRGPDSVGVLRCLMRLGATALLGNHDLHLLATAHGAQPIHRSDTLADVLDAPDRVEMLEWLRQRPLALLERCGQRTYLLVHAGVLPSWTEAQTLILAQEVESVLRGPGLLDWLRAMYGDWPAAWTEDLTGYDRHRVVVNALTRLRFCTPQGEMEFATKDSAGAAPPGYVPWFDAPDRQTAHVVVAFGHWSTLGSFERPNLLALDSGCVWGGCLSAVELKSAAPWHEWIQVRCPQAQRPTVF